MTKDNEGRRNDMGDPGTALEPADVIQCRECGNMVRRVNTQHLQTDRCRFTDQDEFHREDKLRPDHPETIEEYREKHPGAPVLSPREKIKLAEVNHSREADQRRKEILKRRWRGDQMTRIVEDVAAKYDVSESTVWSDWSRREKWISRVFGLEDAEAAVVEALAQKQDVRERLLSLARRAEDQNEVGEAIRALKAVDSNIDEAIEHQQRLGNVEQAASQHEVHVRHSDGVGSGLDEDTLRQLDELSGGEDEEVIDAEFREVPKEEGDA